MNQDKDTRTAAGAAHSLQGAGLAVVPSPARICCIGRNYCNHVRKQPHKKSAWMRTREVWMHAVDLDVGAAFPDIPASLLERLLANFTGAWRARGTYAGLAVKVTDLDFTFGDTTSASARTD